jgi:hypothetical protein
VGNTSSAFYEIADWLNELDDSSLSDSGFLTEEGKGILEGSFFADLDREDLKEDAQKMLDQKADSIGRWLCNLDITIKALENEQKYLKKRKDAAKNTFESLKEFARQSMFSRNIKKAGITHPLTRVGTRGRVVPVDEDAVPAEFTKLKIKVHMNDLTDEERVMILKWIKRSEVFEIERIFEKEKIREAMKERPIPGVEFREGETLKFRQAVPKD